MASKEKPCTGIPAIKFELSPKQLKKLNAWAKKLPKPKTSKHGFGLQYIFSPTGIGDGVEVVDRATQRKIDLTDYDSW